MKNLELNWQGKLIRILCNENYCPVYADIYKERLIHIELFSEEVIPITQTGYCSIFMTERELREQGSIERYIERELERLSQSREWREIVSVLVEI